MNTPIILIPLIGDWTTSMPALTKCWELINFPSMQFSEYWIHHKILLPRGEISWIIALAVSIMFQWIIISLLICLFPAIKKKYWVKTGSVKTGTGKRN